MNYLVFYAGLLYKELATNDKFRNLQVFCPTEIYNGGYLYVRTDRMWYLMDGTPLLDCDVPKELKTTLLLLL